MEQMTKSELYLNNEKRINELNNDVSAFDIDSLAIDEEKLNLYVKYTCEINIRSIIKKYLSGEELSVKEKSDVAIFINIYDSCIKNKRHVNLDLYETLFGSGDFSDIELLLINEINNVYSNTNEENKVR